MFVKYLLKYDVQNNGVHTLTIYRLLFAVQK